MVEGRKLWCPVEVVPEMQDEARPGRVTTIIKNLICAVSGLDNGPVTANSGYFGSFRHYFIVFLSSLVYGIRIRIYYINDLQYVHISVRAINT